MDELLNSKESMTTRGQEDHAEDVDQLDNTYKELLNQAGKQCAILEDAVKMRTDYACSVDELQECLESCVEEWTVLEQPGVPVEDKLNKCQVWADFVFVY